MQIKFVVFVRYMQCVHFSQSQTHFPALSYVENARFKFLATNMHDTKRPHICRDHLEYLSHY